MCQCIHLFRSLNYFTFLFLLFFFCFEKKQQAGIIIMPVICNHKYYKSKADKLGENAVEIIKTFKIKTSRFEAKTTGNMCLLIRARSKKYMSAIRICYKKYKDWFNIILTSKSFNWLHLGIVMRKTNIFCLQTWSEWASPSGLLKYERQRSS